MKFTSFVFFLLLIVNSSSAQFNFQRVFGGGGIEGSWCVKQTSDKGYIVTAESTSFGPGANDVYVVKTDSVGLVMWMKSYGGSNSTEYGNFIMETFDGGLANLGRAHSFGFGSSDYYLIKMDAQGNVLWSKTYGGASYEEGYSMAQTADSGFVLAGYTESFGSGQSDLLLIKTDSLGNINWTKTYGGSGIEGISGYGNISIHQIYNDGFILAGYTNSFGAGSFDFYLLKLDTIGNLEWSRTYGGTGIDYGYGNSVGRSSDGGYIITGHTESFGSGMSDVYVVKADSVGNLEWSKTYGGSNMDYGYSIQQTNDFGYIIGGATASFGNGGYDAYLLKIDVSGNLMWSRAIGGTGDDFAYSVDQAEDEGYILTGYTDSFGNGTFDVYLVKTDTLGNGPCYSVPALTIETNPPTIMNYPATIVGTGGGELTVSTMTTSGGGESLPCGNLSATIAITDACSTVCNGVATAIAVGGVPPYTYQWNDPPQYQTTSTATGLCAGWYQCVITDASGIQVGVNSFLNYVNTITTTITSVGTIGTTGSATVVPSGGAPPYTYVWNDPLNQTTQTANNLSPGIYTVVISDSNGCSTSDMIEVFDVTGLSELDDAITISPNPFDDKIHVKHSGNMPFNVELIDNFGRVLLRSKSQNVLSTENLSKGTYILRIYNNQMDYRRVVIKS